MTEKVPWDFWVLYPLETGRPVQLKDIYAGIEQLRPTDSLNPKLFGVSGKWGNRKDYTHVVRSTMSSLRKRGLVERVGKGARTGIYRITPAGYKYLEEIEP